MSINDLQPQNRKITIKGVELTCKPIRLKHALVLSRVGAIFGGESKATPLEVDNAQKQVDEIFGELIPELKGMELDLQVTIELLQELLAGIEPDDNKELREKGVKFDSDPKEVGNG